MQDYYEQKNLWEREFTSQEAERLDLVNKIIPSNVKTILDVGCGSGALTNYFDNNRYEITGLDRSKEALKHYKHNKIEGSVDRLPFADNSFDLVICSDVLEHLPSDILKKTIDELKRVSGKYLLIISPNNEELLQNSTQCKKCGTIYHINNHLHSFNIDNLKQMFVDDFDINLISYFGDRWNFKHEDILKTAHNMGIFIQYENAICPECGLKCDVTDFERIDNSKKLLDILNKIEFKPQNEKCEILILFEHKKNIFSFVKSFFSKDNKTKIEVLQKKNSHEGLFCSSNNANIQKPICFEIEKTRMLPRYQQYHTSYLEQSPLYGKIIINENSNWFYNKSSKAIYLKNNYGKDNHAIFEFPSAWMIKNNKITIVYEDNTAEQIILQIYNASEYQTIGILSNTGSNKVQTDLFEFLSIKTIKNHLLFRLISPSQNDFLLDIQSVSFNSKKGDGIILNKPKSNNNILQVPYPIYANMAIVQCDFLVYRDEKNELYYLSDGVFCREGCIQ